ncbi:MAG: hypothetical protein GY712_02660 [Oceanicoccus sp.]|uniref:hypothetical protein n=1 Tax=Oceanicoccus sp. TaxID=2691044 RepID=UPI002608A665|nr:hypothetical protein [Oceanicoccus sp.]MCP3906897.1 hypothetical protein [Oceanicoccus sp.]
MIILYLIFLFSNVEHYYVNAPELIRGEAISYHAEQLHISIIDGGDWQAAQIGKRKGDIETGVFVRIAGAHIDNNDMPVPYRVEWRDNGKYNGGIYYRTELSGGNPRKLCAAPLGRSLPCR